MKNIFLIVCLATLLFSCEKEHDDSLAGENNQQRITSIKEYTNGTLRSVENYSYDDIGRLIALENKLVFSEIGGLIDPYRYLYKYKDNKIIEFREGFNPKTDPMYKKEREIENGMVTNINGLVWIDESWVLVEEASYIYSDSKLNRWTQVKTLDQGVKTTEGEIVYDGDFPVQKTRKNTYDNYMDMTGIAYMKEMYTYSNEKLQEVIIYRKHDDMTDWEISEKTEFLRSDQEIIQNVYDYSEEETWVLEETTISTFNGNGNIATKKTVFPDSDYYRETVIEYENIPGNLEIVLMSPQEDIF